MAAKINAAGMMQRYDSQIYDCRHLQLWWFGVSAACSSHSGKFSTSSHPNQLSFAISLLVDALSTVVSWEVNRGSDVVGVALAMTQWFIHLQAERLKTGR